MAAKHFFLTTALGLFLSISMTYGQSNQQKVLETKRQKILKEIKQMNALLFSNKKEQKSVLTLIEDLNYKINVRQNLIKITNEQANLLTREINANQKEITILRTQLRDLKEDYAGMIVKSYKGRSEQSKVMFLLSSENFKQAYKRLHYIKQYKDYQKMQGEAIVEKAKTLQDLNIRLSKQKEAKKQLIKENRNAEAQLEGELKNRETIMASIKSNLSKYESELKKKKQEAAQLDKEINRLIKAAIAESNKKAGKKTSTGAFVLTPEAKTLAANFEANKGRLGWPVTRGVVKGKYGIQRSLTDNSVTQNYKSIYIATEEKAEVKSVFNGEVSGILIVKNGNPAVMIRHGNYLSVYMNLSKISVKKGDKVTTGQVIGEVFTNKANGETLLGFRIYKNDEVTNPEPWLEKL